MKCRLDSKDQCLVYDKIYICPVCSKITGNLTRILSLRIHEYYSCPLTHSQLCCSYSSARLIFCSESWVRWSLRTSIQVKIISHISPARIYLILDGVIWLFYISPWFQHAIHDLTRDFQVCYCHYSSHLFPYLPEYRLRSDMPEKIALLFLCLHEVVP